MLIVDAVWLAKEGIISGQNLWVKEEEATFAKFFKLLIAGCIILAVAAVVICVCACVIKPLCARYNCEIVVGLAPLVA